MLELFFGTVTLAAALRLTTPILISAVGGCFNSKAGTVNIAHEAVMLIATFIATIGSYYTGSPWLGSLCAILAGIVIAVIYNLFVFHFGSHPMVFSIALNLGASGFTTLLLYALFKTRGSFMDPRIKSYSVVDIPVIRNLPFFGKFLNGQIPLVYLAWVLVAIFYYIMYRTPFGLRIRSIGTNDRASQTAGVNVIKYKWIANIISGAMDGLAGSFLPLCTLSMFTEDMTSGRGFLAVAAILVGRGNPLAVALSALVFGYASALTVSFQNLNVASQLIEMMPYIATVLVLTVSGVIDFYKIQRAKHKKNYQEEK